MSIFQKKFWQDTTERTVRGFAQGVVLGLGAAHFTDIGNAVSTGEAAAVGGLGMAVLTFFTCIAASQVGDEGTASFLPDPPQPPDPGAQP